MRIPTLTTERLVLRAPEVADFAPFASHYMSPRSSYEGGPHSREGRLEGVRHRRGRLDAPRLSDRFR